jgi:long-chain acyl-CoA synthetase
VSIIIKKNNITTSFFVRGANLWPAEEQTTTLGLLPFFHIYATTTTMNMGLQFGSKIVTLPKFDPEDYVQALETHKVAKRLC